MLQRLWDFRAAVTNARNLVATAHTLDAAGGFLWPADARATIVEAAFLKIFIAWETLLEAVFLDLLMGTVSAAGNTIVRFAAPIDRDHANRMLIGTMRFVDWATPQSIRKLSQIYLDRGHPFETIFASIHSEIIDLKTIRNAAAHLSSSTSAQLDALASRKLGRTVANIAPSALLLSIDPSSGAGDTILDTYIALLDAAAVGLVHA